MNANRWALCIFAVTSLLLAAPQARAAPEALPAEWGPERVSEQLAPTARMVGRFAARMLYSSGCDPGAEQGILAQGREGVEASLRGLLRELPSSDRFRFMVAFTMYWLEVDQASSRDVMLEYCPPDGKPAYAEDTIAFLDFACQRRSDPALLKGILGWVPSSDGASAAILSRILPDAARSQPRDLLAALSDASSLVWNRAASLLFDPDAESPDGAYPAIVAIADDPDDPLQASARELLREMASGWPAADQWPSSPDYAPGTPAAAGLPFYHLALLIPPIAVNGEWYLPTRQFCQWLRAGLTLSENMSAITVTWRGESRTWTRASGRLAFKDGTAFIPIQEFGEAFGERVSLRPDEPVVDFGTPGEGRVYAAIPVGWQNPVLPKGLSQDETEIWRRLLRPNTRSGSVKCEPYDIRIAGRWAAAKVHPLNLLTDDALVLLDRYWGAWRIIAIGADLPARGRNYGIPAEARRRLGLSF